MSLYSKVENIVAHYIAYDKTPKRIFMLQKYRETILDEFSFEENKIGFTCFVFYILGLKLPITFVDSIFSVQDNTLVQNFNIHEDIFVI